MSSKRAVGKAVKTVGKMGRKKLVRQVDHGNFLETYIPAGQASAAPPLGSQLGERGINVGQFCKEFNLRTENIIDGAPIPSRIYIKPDRSFELKLLTPASRWFFFRAAGIRRGSMDAVHEVAGLLSVKHIYEIAKIKSQDEPNLGVPLERVCRNLINTARSCGIKVVKSLNVDELQTFLDERRIVVKEQLKKLEEEKMAKTLRTA